MIEELPDLAKEVKKIWRQSDEWRRNRGNIEFSIETCCGNKEWFPFCMAPVRVTEYVSAWGMLNAKKCER